MNKLASPQRLPARHPTFPFSAKLTVAFVGLALIPMIILGITFFYRTERILGQRISLELGVEVETAANNIEIYLGGVRRDVHSLARFLQHRLHHGMSNREWREVEREFLQTMKTEKTYYQVRFLTADGREALRVNNINGSLKLVPEHELQYKGDRYYFREAIALRPGDIYLSPLDFNVEHDQIEEPRRLVTRLATPVADSAGKVFGIVVINVFGEEILSSLEKLKPQPGIRVVLLDNRARFVEMRQHAKEISFHSGDEQELAKFIDSPLPAAATINRSHVITGPESLNALATVHAGPDNIWRLVKIYPRRELFAEINALRRTSILFALPLTLMAALLAVISARHFSSPVRQLSRFAEAVAGGDYLQQQTVFRRDELGQLADSLNAMGRSLSASRQRLEEWNQNLQEQVERKMEELRRSEENAQASRKVMHELERQLIQADRLASLGMLSATIAHEIANPLAGLKLRLQLLQKRITVNAELGDELEKMLALVDRLTVFLRQLTGYISSAKSGKRQWADLCQILRELEFILREEADRRQTTLTLEFQQTPLPILSYGQHLHQIFMNLILNALQAIEREGTVQVVAKIDGEWIEVRVRDTGPGIGDAAADRIFEPLFTTKENGTGLGLAVVKRLVEELDGEVTLENHPAGGAVAVVKIPGNRAAP